MVIPPEVLLLLILVFDILDILLFHMNLRIAVAGSPGVICNLILIPFSKEGLQTRNESGTQVTFLRTNPLMEKTESITG